MISIFLSFFISCRKFCFYNGAFRQNKQRYYEIIYIYFCNFFFFISLFSIGGLFPPKPPTRGFAPGPRKTKKGKKRKKNHPLNTSSAFNNVRPRSLVPPATPICSFHLHCVICFLSECLRVVESCHWVVQLSHRIVESSNRVIPSYRRVVE